MYSYIFKKTVNLFLTLFVVVTLTFFILESIPGTPLSYLGHSVGSQMKANFLVKHGLNLPLMERYLMFLKNIFIHWDLGNSMIYPGRVVIDEIRNYGGTSFLLGIKGMFLGLILGLTGALVTVETQSKALKNFMEVISLILISIPNFITASLVYYIFAIKFPEANIIVLGRGESSLAVICIALSITGIYMKYIRETILEELRKDYVIQARLKGYRGVRLLLTHVLRNALAPVMSLLLPQIAGLFMGFYIIEGIFSIPGFGNIYIDSVNNKDYNMILGATIVFTLIYVVTVYLTDILYAILDPRIRRRLRNES